MRSSDRTHDDTVGSQLLVFEGLGCGIRDRGIEGQRTVCDDHLATCEHHRLGVSCAGSHRVQQHGVGNLGPSVPVVDATGEKVYLPSAVMRPSTAPKG
nr:hypothetical protein [Diaphorobacter sp. JS3050]